MPELKMVLVRGLHSFSGRGFVLLHAHDLRSISSCFCDASHAMLLCLLKGDQVSST